MLHQIDTFDLMTVTVTYLDADLASLLGEIFLRHLHHLLLSAVPAERRIKQS